MGGESERVPHFRVDFRVSFKKNPTVFLFLPDFSGQNLNKVDSLLHLGCSTQFLKVSWHLSMIRQSKFSYNVEVGIVCTSSILIVS